jgi:hypothetical protein
MCIQGLLGVEEERAPMDDSRTPGMPQTFNHS